VARRRFGCGLGHPNIEFFPLTRVTRGIAGHPGVPAGNPPSVRAWAQRDYGNRVGIWRPMDLLSKHGVRASSTLNSDICDHHPQIVRTAIEFGWEIRGHNQTNSVWLDQLSREEERQTIAGTLSRIAEMTGRKPVGWLGAGLAETWHTLDFLVADWVNDEQPYFSWMSAASGWCRSRTLTRSTMLRTSSTGTARSTSLKG
jgi:peptidoglycan/xylan/chitin deacetylase (PgdA/CDA1 family)